MCVPYYAIISWVNSRLDLVFIIQVASDSLCTLKDFLNYLLLYTLANRK